MDLKGKIQMTGQTDIGQLREHNEDAIACDEAIGLAILADGMGGHRGGEMASAITVSTILESLSQQLKHRDKTPIDEDSGYSGESLAIHQAIALANKNVFESSQKNARYQGMGTTVVVLLFYDNRCSIAHVGDSRLYRLRDKTLEQMTSDHSVTQELIDRGLYTPEQAKHTANRNLITRAIGIEPRVQIDIQEDIVRLDDVFLLCSDGVTDMIDDSLIQTILQKHKNNLSAAAAKIIQQANKMGGKDNISVLLAKPVQSFPARNHPFSRLLSLFFP